MGIEPDPARVHTLRTLPFETQHTRGSFLGNLPVGGDPGRGTSNRRVEPGSLLEESRFDPNLARVRTREIPTHRWDRHLRDTPPPPPKGRRVGRTDTTAARGGHKRRFQRSRDEAERDGSTSGHRTGGTGGHGTGETGNETEKSAAKPERERTHGSQGYGRCERRTWPSTSQKKGSPYRCTIEPNPRRTCASPELKKKVRAHTTNDTGSATLRERRWHTDTDRLTQSHLQGSGIDCSVTRAWKNLWLRSKDREAS